MNINSRVINSGSAPMIYPLKRPAEVRVRTSPRRRMR